MPNPEPVTSPESIDPLTPRPDDPRIGRWWWPRRLHHRRGRERPVFFRWPAVLVLMVLLVGVVAFAVVRLARAA